jgi:hypothetical protein
MRVRLLPIVCELERLYRVRAPEQDSMRNKASDLEVPPKEIGDTNCDHKGSETYR